MTSRLRLGLLEFDLKLAQLTGTLADPHLARLNGIDPESLPLLWDLSLEAAPRQVESGSWSPTLGVSGLRPPVRRWAELAPRTLHWAQDPDRPLPDEPAATIYLLTHEATRDNVLRFGERAGERIAFGWRAIADLQGPAPLDRAVAVVASGTLQFAGITVDTSERETDAQVRARLARRIALDGLRAQRRELLEDAHSDGARRARLRFLPTSREPPR